MMKILVKKIVVFLSPVIIVWGVLEYFYRVNESNYSYKHRMITENYEDIETLILGNSHSLFGVNPKYLDSKAFNLANVSQSLYFDELLFKKHIDSLKNLKQLILTISYFNLDQLENEGEDTWRKYFYSNQMDIETPIVSKFNIRAYSVVLARKFKKSIESIEYYIDNGTMVWCNTDGWGTLYEKTRDIDLCKNGFDIAKKHEGGLQDFTENLTRIQSIIDYCKKIECKVYLVEMPTHFFYVDALDQKKWGKISSVCEKLEANNVNTTYINFRKDFRLEESDLYDADHLNHKGAKKYTEIINQIISDPKNDD